MQMTASGDPHRSTGRAAGRPAHLGHLALLYVAFAALCLITSYFYSTGSLERRENVGPDGLVGPIEITGSNSVYEVAVHRTRSVTNTWSYVEVQVLDANKEYLFSFGDELSLYSGRDSEGFWRERNETYSTKLTIPEPGTYFLKFVIEESSRANSGFGVTLSRMAGSSLVHLVAGIAALVIGIVLNELRNRTISRMVALWLDHD